MSTTPKNCIIPGSKPIYPGAAEGFWEEYGQLEGNDSPPVAIAQLLGTARFQSLWRSRKEIMNGLNPENGRPAPTTPTQTVLYLDFACMRLQLNSSLLVAHIEAQPGGKEVTAQLAADIRALRSSIYVILKTELRALQVSHPAEYTAGKALVNEELAELARIKAEPCTTDYNEDDKIMALLAERLQE